MSCLLPIRQVEKPWGREALPAPFVAPLGRTIGEIWFEPPAELDRLLVKYLFTSEKLSVQVHPTDTCPPRGGECPQGKEECWLVVDAEPGATLGIGFKGTLSQEAMRAAALDGSIEELMAWYEAKAGDFFYIPAGTVHAIGPGISLIEVQQNCDVTYRLYDYGRPRELHLDDAIAVAIGAPHDPALRRRLPPLGHQQLAEGPFFRLDRVDGVPPDAVRARYPGALFAIPLAGYVELGPNVILPGQCVLAEQMDDLFFPEASQCLLAQPCQGAR